MPEKNCRTCKFEIIRKGMLKDDSVGKLMICRQGHMRKLVLDSNFAVTTMSIEDCHAWKGKE
jgi:hypothetical protein